jgi:hypothetical protein
MQRMRGTALDIAFCFLLSHTASTDTASRDLLVSFPLTRPPRRHWD